MGGFRAPRILRVRPGADGGFSLVEVMVAMVIFAVVSTATVTIVIQALRTVRENSERVMAANIARSQVEALRFQGAETIPIGLSEGGPVGMDPAFSVTTTANWVGFDQTTSACDAVSPGTDYLRVHVEVRSPSLASPVVSDTVIAPDVEQAAISGGSAAISVEDHIGQPVADVEVRGVDTGHPENSFVLTTGPDGCLFIPDLSPSGSLVVTVSHAGLPTYVSNTPTGASKTVPIATGALSRPTFLFAPSASIQFAGTDSEYAPPGALPASWQISETNTTVQASALGGTVADLWPTSSGFTAWAGQCAEADPSGFPGIVRQGFALQAGGNTVATLATAPVKLRGLPADEPVTAEYRGPDGTCTGWTIALGRSNDRGILKVGLPYGRWAFSADTETKVLDDPLAPPAEGAAADPVLVNFTLADLDNPSPSPTVTPTESGTGEPSGSAEPSETGEPESSEPAPEPSPEVTP